VTIDERQQASITYQTIQRQPDDLRTMFAREVENVSAAATVLRSATRIFTLGIGSSHHASQVGAWFLRAAGKDALAVQAFDFLHYPKQWPTREGDAVVLFGHTGSTGFTRKTLDRLVADGIPVVAVGSTKAEHPGAAVVLRTTEPEQAATYTSSHLCAMAIVARVAVALGADFGDALDGVPDQIADILARQSEIWSVAERIEGKRIYSYGAGPNEVTATELMIKVREAAFHVIDGMAAEQFLHGPTVSFNKGDVAIVINVPGAGQERVQGIAKVNAAMGGDIWPVGQAIPGLDVTHFALPVVPEPISALLAVVPMQLMATRLSAIRGTNPDSFRMDDPVYDAAFRKVGF
jgi:glucosamine--fructose-6-phosphate aminotransferase (isomerizing)